MRVFPYIYRPDVENVKFCFSLVSPTKRHPQTTAGNLKKYSLYDYNSELRKQKWAPLYNLYRGPAAVGMGESLQNKKIKYNNKINQYCKCAIAIHY